MTTHHGESQVFETDERGLLTKVTDQDDNAIEYSYDALERLAQASNHSSTVAFERDLVGNIVVDRQVLDGEEVVVKTTFDLSGTIIRVESSLGYALDIERNSMFEPARLLLVGRLPV
jgi:YD repeat-containing protein